MGDDRFTSMRVANILPVDRSTRRTEDNLGGRKFPSTRKSDKLRANTFASIRKGDDLRGPRVHKY